MAGKNAHERHEATVTKPCSNLAPYPPVKNQSNIDFAKKKTRNIEILVEYW